MRVIMKPILECDIEENKKKSKIINNSENELVYYIEQKRNKPVDKNVLFVAYM